MIFPLLNIPMQYTRQRRQRTHIIIVIHKYICYLVCSFRQKLFDIWNSIYVESITRNYYIFSYLVNGGLTWNKRESNNSQRNICITFFDCNQIDFVFEFLVDLFFIKICVCVCVRVYSYLCTVIYSSLGYNNNNEFQLKMPVWCMENSKNL